MHETECHQSLNVTMCYNSNHSMQSRHSPPSTLFLSNLVVSVFIPFLFPLYFLSPAVVFRTVLSNHPQKSNYWHRTVVAETLTILYASSVNRIQTEGCKRISFKHTKTRLSKWEKMGNLHRPAFPQTPLSPAPRTARYSKFPCPNLAQKSIHFLWDRQS